MEPVHTLRELDDLPDPFERELEGALPDIDVRKLPASPTRAEVRRKRAVAVVAALVYEAALLAMMGLRPDLATAPRAALALGFLAPVAALALAVASSARSRGRGLGEPPVRIASAMVGAIVLFAVAAVLGPHDSSASDATTGATLACAMGVMMLAFAPLVLVAVAFRRAFTASAPWRTAALGVACGALAAAAIHLRCAIDDPIHVIVGHGAAIALGAIAGAFVLSRFTRA